LFVREKYIKGVEVSELTVTWIDVKAEIVADTPVLIITLKLKNESTESVWYLSPIGVILKALVGHKEINIGRENCFLWKGMKTYSLEIKKDKDESEELVCPISLSAITNIEEARESTGTGDVLLKVELSMPIMVEKGIPKLFNRHVENPEYYGILASKWTGFLRKWGYAVKWVQMPEKVVKKLREKAKEHGMTKEWEIVDRALSAGDMLKNDYSIVHGSSKVRDLEERAINMIKETQKRLLVASQIIDTTVSSEIIGVSKNVGEVKILVSTPKPEWLKRERDARGIALQDLFSTKNIEVRISGKLHARFLVVDEKLLLGSMDLDRQGLTVHDNLAVYTNDSVLVKRSLEEFSKMWKDAKKLEDYFKEKKISSS